MSQKPFNKILIANRGEIALRIMRTARAMGYRTVAIYSEADRDSLHVRAAGQAVCVGGALPRDSYLRIDSIIAAAKSSGADAVHPGYGFLAENANFARACHDAGLVFIGPSPEVIDAMGDKASAKRLMIAAGVPCIPGYEGTEQSDVRLREEAQRIGYPLMIKAAAGGGGRGMRLVHFEKDFDELLISARSEAQSAFGNANVILERAIANARHIEIQVFGDRFGNAIHLGERDCSVQRRHQKLIEESPSSAISPALRERMGEVAVKAAKAIGYEGAGTLEFLLDESGAFYFMEMNTRLQVEHPVTEAITGLDLVELQLRVAAGEALPIAQSDVKFIGHAIEVRLCAEDARQSFMPQSGTLLDWRASEHLRVEHALETGVVISPYYDSMVAKFVSFGATRDEARLRLIAGLSDTLALGVKTNQTFLLRCLAHSRFANGKATTAFIESNLSSLNQIDAARKSRAVNIAATLFQSCATHAPNEVQSHRFPNPVRLEIDGELRDIVITSEKRRCFAIALDGNSAALEMVKLEAGCATFIYDGVLQRAEFHRDGSQIWLQYDDENFFIEDKRFAPAVRSAEKSNDGKVRASMNGRAVCVLVSVGDDVLAGQPMVVLEAMKMEHVHRAPSSGKVLAMTVAVGDQVAARRVIAEVGPQ